MYMILSPTMIQTYSPSQNQKYRRYQKHHNGLKPSFKGMPGGITPSFPQALSSVSKRALPLPPKPHKSPFMTVRKAD
eukprot:309872-Pelagomonas_calceolata.AAC.1